MTWGFSGIKSAYDKGRELGATHMIISHDSVGFDNTATYVLRGEDPRTVWENSSARSSGYSAIDEVYAYYLGWGVQSLERRANHWDQCPTCEGEGYMADETACGDPEHCPPTVACRCTYVD